MLPMTLQFLVVMIASAINDRLQRKLDYVEEERRILQEQLDATTGGKKLSFTADQRPRLATAGKQLTPDERRKCCRLVKSETIRVLEPFRLLRRAALAPGHQGIHGPLSWRTVSSGTGRTADRKAGRLNEREGGSWQGRLPVSAGRDVELLLPRGRLSAGDDLLDIPGRGRSAAPARPPTV
jgi:hypothetical protein